MDQNNLVEKILALKEKEKTVIHAHNYQLPEVQRVADFVGDSLELARKACSVEDARYILFAGVDFMAETAAILNPDKTVLIPTLEARCPMAAQLPKELLILYKREHPGAEVVLYVNTLAEAKAEADCVCTSANAPRIVGSMSSETILFGPDANLGYFVQQQNPDKKLVFVPHDGYCYVHKKFTTRDILDARREHPGAEVLVHPECDPGVQRLADHICSTGQMVRRVQVSPAEEFIVATEKEMCYTLKSRFPEKEFYPARKDAICLQMKKNTLLNVYDSLRSKRFVVRVEKDVSKRAKLAIEKMLELSP